MPLATDALAAIRKLPDAARVVTDTTVPLSWGGSPIEAHGWSSAALTPYRISRGHAPRASDQVVVDGNLASRTKLGATVTLAHGGTDGEYRVVGIATAASPNQPGRAEHVFLTDAAASALAPHGRAVPKVVGVFARSLAASESASEIRAQVPLAAAYTGNERGAAEFLLDAGAARGTLVAIGSSFAGTAILIALFVLDRSTLSLSIQRRRRDFALLRAIGATPMQIHRLIAQEVLIVAGAGALVGVIPGFLLAVAMRAGFAHAGVIPQDFALTFGPAPALIAVVVMVVASQLAAAVTARRPARINPIEALQEASTTPSRLRRGRTITWCSPRSNRLALKRHSAVHLGARSRSLGRLRPPCSSSLPSVCSGQAWYELQSRFSAARCAIRNRPQRFSQPRMRAVTRVGWQQRSSHWLSASASVWCRSARSRSSRPRPPRNHAPG